MDLPESPLDNFQETFCAQYGVPSERFEETVLRLTLYPHARWLAEIGPRRLLSADRRFVASVGRLTRWKGFTAEVHDYQNDPENRRFWRHRLRLRVSVRRMRDLFSEVMGGTTASSQARSPARGETDPDTGSIVAE